MKYHVLAAAVVTLFFVSTAFAAFPQPVGFVNDFANILPERDFIEAQLQEYERNTTIEIAVVTIEALPENYDMYSYSVELFQAWGIGKKGEDNGILVLIIKNGTAGSRMKIELGYGIQGYITGAEAGRILDEALPYYEAGDYQGAVATILVGLGRQLENYVPGQAGPGDGASFSDSAGWVSVLPYVVPLIWIIAIPIGIYASGRCPSCKKWGMKSDGDYWVCKNCGKRTKKRRYATAMAAGGFMGGGGFGGGGGGGGFGGGGSGGGGAGR